MKWGYRKKNTPAALLVRVLIKSSHYGKQYRDSQKFKIELLYDPAILKKMKTIIGKIYKAPRSLEHYLQQPNMEAAQVFTDR